MNVARRPLVILLLIIGLLACSSPHGKAPTHAVRAVETTAALSALTADLDRTHSHSDFGYMDPEHREVMHGVIHSIYRTRAALRDDLSAAESTGLISIILGDKQIQDLRELRQQVFAGVQTTGIYFPVMSPSQQHDYLELNERLNEVDRLLADMRAIPNIETNTRAVASMLHLAAAVARAR